MGSFNDYLEILKYTVDYIQAKAQDEFANSVLAQMQRTGISKEDLVAETLMRDEFINDVLGGNTTEPLLNIEDICAIASTFNCDVKIELVPKEGGNDAQHAKHVGSDRANAPNTLEKRCKALEQEAGE